MAGYLTEAEAGICLDSGSGESRMHLRVTDPDTGTHFDLCMPITSEGLFAMIGMADHLPRIVVAAVDELSEAPDE